MSGGSHCELARFTETLREGSRFGVFKTKIIDNDTLKYRQQLFFFFLVNSVLFLFNNFKQNQI